MRSIRVVRSSVLLLFALGLSAIALPAQAATDNLDRAVSEPGNVIDKSLINAVSLSTPRGSA